MPLQDLMTPLQHLHTAVPVLAVLFESTLPWGGWVLLLLLAYGVRRLGLNYYGTNANPSVVPLCFFLLALGLVHDARMLSVFLFVALLLLIVQEKILESYGRKRRIVTMSELGILIAFLSHLHPLFLSLVPYVFFNFKKIDLLKGRQVAAFALGFFAVSWSLALLLYILYGYPQVLAIYQEYLHSLLLLTPWTGYYANAALIVRDIGLLLLFLMLFFNTVQALPQALERQRFILKAHLQHSFLFILLYFLYHPVLPVFYISLILILPLLSGFYFTHVKDKWWRLLLLLPYLCILYSFVHLSLF